MLIDYIASALIIPLCFINSIPEKLKNRVKVLIYLTSLTILLAVYFLSNIEIIHKSVAYIDCIACLLLIILFGKERLLNTMSAIMGYIITVVLNNIILLFLDTAINISVVEIYSSLYILISFYIVNSILVFIVCRFLRAIIKKLDYLSLKKHRVSHLILSELAVCMFILIFNIGYGNLINYPSETIYFNCILFVLYFIISILLISKIIKTTKQAILTEEKEKQYAELESYIKLVDENNRQLRKFKHDYLNILFTLDLLIKEKRTEELERYFNENILATKNELETTTEKLSPLSNITDVPIRSLLTSKFNQAVSKHIDIGINIDDNINIPLLKPIELARILGILLDNAIEAASENSNPEIAFSCSNDNETCVITISNTFDTKSEISIDNILENGVSTKGKERGLGLKTVKEILDEYENILTNVSVTENIFSFTITIEK